MVEEARFKGDVRCLSVGFRQAAARGIDAHCLHKDAVLVQAAKRCYGIA